MYKQLIRLSKSQKLKVFKGSLVKSCLFTDNLNVNYFKPNLYIGAYCNSSSSVDNERLHRFNENEFAYNVISKDLLHKLEINTRHATLHEFESILDRNWRQSTATEIVKAFQSVKDYCIINKIALDDKRFDKLVDGLMDHCEKLTYIELLELLKCLVELPITNGYDAHNFHDIWSCLDDICCWQMLEWDVEQSFAIANLWYKLHLGRICDYIFVLLDRLTKKADKLNKNQLVNVFFYLNACRKRSVDFEYEYVLAEYADEMHIDELAVVAMGYFKTKSKIKIPSIMQVMINKVINHSTTIQDIPLSAILKILRLSKPFKLLPEIDKMLDNLVPEISRLSDLSCLHIALLSTGTQSYHQNTIQKVSERIVNNIHNKQKVRLKDIERILNVLTMFDYDPKTEPDIFQASYEELHSQNRADEIDKYSRCWCCALYFLSIRNMYSDKLMNKMLNVDYITEVYGKGAKLVPRELFSLDCSIDIECPWYNGNRLPKELRYKAAKWLTEFTPSKDQKKKISSADQLILDTINITKDVVGGEEYIIVDHILPHFPRADIVVCKNKKTGAFVKPRGFSTYTLGDVMYPDKTEDLIWYSIVIVGWHNTIQGTNIPLGMMLMKKRQLERIGYMPVFVIWKEFLSLTEENRQLYVSSKLQ